MWDKFVKREFIALWSQLPSKDKQAVTQAMEALAVDPLNYEPTPVRLMNDDFLIVTLHYWIQYRLDDQQRRVIFIKLLID